MIRLRRLVWTLFALVCATAACGRAHAPSRSAAASAAAAAARWGIEPVSLRPTLAGTMLDFRFKVVDAAKAKPLFDRHLKPYLWDAKSHVALGPGDSKLGALRASVRNPPVKGKSYYVMFTNGFGSVARGHEVTIAIGDCKLEHVVVE
jgi:hypothetical protein